MATSSAVHVIECLPCYRTRKHFGGVECPSGASRTHQGSKAFLYRVHKLNPNLIVPFIDCYNEAASLKQRHEKFLGDVPTVRIEKFLRILQETMTGKTVKQALDSIQREFSLNLEEDMNKLGDRELQRRKELMDMNFKKNQIKPGDDEFVYDKQVDFSAVKKVESGWDDENEEDDFWT